MRRWFGLLLFAISFVLVAQDKGMKVKARYQSESGGHKWAVIIGINSYKDSRIPSLNYAVNDAVGLHKALVDPDIGGFDPNKVKLISDSSVTKPTRENILRSLNTIETISTSNDVVFLYFSGHGIASGGVSYFLPSDAKVDLLSDTGIPMTRFTQPLDKTKAKVQILFFDSCHSGIKLGDKTVSGAMEKETFRHIYQSAEGRVILSSCALSQVSYEYPEKGHGVFSYFLIEALNGKADLNSDGLISVSETANYTTENVLEWSFSTGKVQSPQLNATTTGDVVLGLSKGTKVITTLQVEGKAIDTKPPEIEIDHPKIGIGGVLEISMPENNSLSIRGSIKDDVKLDSVTINGQVLQLNSKGYFEVNIPVEKKKSYSFSIRAVDLSGKSSKKDFEISIAEQEKLAGLPPEFVYLPSDVDKSKLDYIIFGMSTQDVLRIQGKPSRVLRYGDTEIDMNNATIYNGVFGGDFLYGESRVTFNIGRGVSTWETVDQKIKAKIWLKKEMTTKKAFTFGDDVYDILYIQGKPDGVFEKYAEKIGIDEAKVYDYFNGIFLYGKSKVVFSSGKVESWKTVDQKLRFENLYLD